MIVLTTSDSLIAKLGGAVTTNQPTYVVTHIDIADDLPDISQGDFNNTTEVTIVSAPGSGFRIIDLGTILMLILCLQQLLSKLLMELIEEQFTMS